MIRETEFRVIVQTKTNSYGFTNLYYPALVSANVSDQIPFAVPSATIDVISNSPLGTSTYVSPFHDDDIIRLQVAEIYGDPYQHTHRSWVEIFSGRIQDMDNDYGSNNVTSLKCVGHAEELEYSPLQADLNYTTTTDARDILKKAFNDGAGRLIDYSDISCQQGVAVPSYSGKKDQTFVADLIQEMEKMSGLKWFADVLPTYKTNNTLDKLNLVWKPISETVTDKYKIREATGRFVSSNFISSIEDLITSYRVDGEAPADTTTTEGNAVTQPAKYTYTATDNAAVASYGKRALSETYTWIKSNTQAQAIATGVLSDRVLPEISGQIVMAGTPYARKGDLVAIELPSTEVNGLKVNLNLPVNRVTHSISNSRYTTTLEVGKKQKKAEDYIGVIAQQVRILKKNQYGLR